MHIKELETLDPLHYSPVNVNECVFGPPFPVVHNQLLGLTHVEGEVVVLAPDCQVSDLPIGCLIIVGDQALMMALESWLATQSWVNREYMRGLCTHTCGAPGLRISVADVVASPYHLGAARQEVKDPVAEGGV